MIDYRSFPELVERILLFSSNSTLVAAGTTCSSLRKYTNKFLTEHLTLSTRAPLDSQKFDWWTSSQFSVPDPLQPNHSQSVPILASIGRDLKPVRVLNIHRDEEVWPGLAAEAILLIKNLPNLEVVRIHDTPKHCITTRHMKQYRDLHTVAFIPVTPSTSELATNARGYGRGNVFINLRYSELPDGDEKLVHQDRVEECYGKECLALGKNQSATFYFFLTTCARVPHTSNSTPLTAPSQNLHDTWRDCLALVADAIVNSTSPNAKFVIVGDKDKTAATTSQRSNISDSTKQGITTSVTMSLVNKAQTWLLDYLSGGYESDSLNLPKIERKATQLNNNIRFITFEEMKEEIGSELYRLVIEP